MDIPHGLPPAPSASSDGEKMLDGVPRTASKNCAHLDQVELGHTMCRACLDRDLARKLKKSVDEITLARQRKELANKHLCDQGILPDIPAGYRHCSKCPSGHHRPLADFDGDNRTCRQHLAEQRERRQRAETAAAAAAAAGTVKSTQSSEPAALPSTGDSGTCTTSLKLRKLIETHEFATKEDAQDFIASLAQTEGVMYIHNEVTATVISFVCHCHAKPASDAFKAGTHYFVNIAYYYFFFCVHVFDFIIVSFIAE